MECTNISKGTEFYTTMLLMNIIAKNVEHAKGKAELGLLLFVLWKNNTCLFKTNVLLNWQSL